MALPTVVNLDIYAGDTFSHVFTYTGGKDLTGATALCQLRTSKTAANPTLEVTPTIVAAENTITLSITSVESQALISQTYTSREYVYDIQVTFADTEVNTPFQGKANVTQDVTRS